MSRVVQIGRQRERKRERTNNVFGADAILQSSVKPTLEKKNN